MSEWIQKQDLYISCLQETHLRSKDTYKVRRWKDIPSKSKAGVAIHILDKIFYCYKRQGHYIIKGSVQEDNCIYMYIYSLYIYTQHRGT